MHHNRSLTLSRKDSTAHYQKYNLPETGRENMPVAAIIREKGSNGDREMAWALYLAGFRVKDVHMTDLITGRETLEEVNMIVFVGGFSNADTLGSAKDGRSILIQRQGKGVARQILCKTRYSIARSVQRVPADGGTGSHYPGKTRTIAKDAAQRLT